MKTAAIIFALAFTLAATGTARAQAINPMQAVGIAEGVFGLVYGAMYPAPRCGPHDAPPPPASQPRPPRYAPAPAAPEQYSSIDDDDDDFTPPRKHLKHNSSQPQTPSAAAADEPGQGGELYSDDAGQPAEEATAEDDAGQPVQHRVSHRRADHRRAAQSQPAAAAIPTGQNSGQVAEIPSLPRASQP